MNKPLAIMLTFALSLSLVPLQAQATTAQIQLTAPSAILIDQETGTVLFEKDPHTLLPPASVTKIMTILLVMEALNTGSVLANDTVYTSAYAASMGGSQVFLKEGEGLPLWEMLKCVVVSSANDASVALAEHIAGSEEAFVHRMNQRAAALGMTNTTFQNATGLPADHHLTTAYDISLMSRELMQHHPDIQDLTTIWMDTIRDGTFGLSNTNRLIHDYTGATGLKTGSTDEALYCMSATAQRDQLSLIAVVLQAPTSADRFSDVTKLLDYGFANYTLTEFYPSQPIPPVPVLLGHKSFLQPTLGDTSKQLVLKSQLPNITTTLTLAENVQAPVAQGQTIGTLEVYCNETLLATLPLLAPEAIDRLSTFDIFMQLLRSLMMST